MDGVQKFNNCANRSPGNVTKKVKVCCNNFKDLAGYECVKRGIFPLSTNVCEVCNEFLQK
jgi:hypothetical protein